MGDGLRGSERAGHSVRFWLFREKDSSAHGKAAPGGTGWSLPGLSDIGMKEDYEAIRQPKSRTRQLHFSRLFHPGTPAHW